MNRLRSAGAVVVSTDVHEPRALLLDQVRHDGERQTVAPKGRVEPGESTLQAARREVREETGLADLLYVGYLGRDAYVYSDRDGSPGEKTVDWFLFASDRLDTQPRSDEGFQAARWVAVQHADQAATHVGFHRYLHKAANLVAWRRALGFSRTLSALVWRFVDDASAVFTECPDACVMVCGSAARGDFVDGWSDVDLIGWNISPSSTTAERLQTLIHQVRRGRGVRISLRLADGWSQDSSGADSLQALKLVAALDRVGTDVAQVVGTGQPTPHGAAWVADLATALVDYRDFAEAQLDTQESDDPIARSRRALSALVNAARLVTHTIAPDGGLGLQDVVAALDLSLPSCSTQELLRGYDQFRRRGARNLSVADALASEVPGALASLVEHVASGLPAGPAPRAGGSQP